MTSYWTTSYQESYLDPRLKSPSRTRVASGYAPASTYYSSPYATTPAAPTFSAPTYVQPTVAQSRHAQPVYQQPPPYQHQGQHTQREYYPAQQQQPPPSQYQAPYEPQPYQQQEQYHQQQQQYQQHGAQPYGYSNGHATIYPVGLENLGNSCFMNSALQCLVSTRPLVNLLQSVHGDRRQSMGGALRALVDTAREHESRANAVLSPRTLFDKVSQALSRSFSGRDYRQHDAHECLRFLLDQLAEETAKPRAPQPAPEDSPAASDTMLSDAAWAFYTGHAGSRIVDLFGGQLKSTLQCGHCGKLSRAFDPFFDLSMPIPQSSSSRTSVEDCLRLFTAVEKLQGDESPKCDHCRARRPAKKSLSLFRLPLVLVLHLKRFTDSGRKINTEVTFPQPAELLDLRPLLDPNAPGRQHAQYRLFAVINHFGTMQGGHYTANCKHPVSQQWHECNDSRVRPIGESSVLTPNAYMVFYERVQ